MEKLPVGTHLEYFLKYRTSCDFNCVFDIGANIGQFSKSLKVFFPNSEIYLFEPVVSPFNILDSNIKGDRLHLFNLGFGNKKGEMEIFVSNQIASQRNSILN